MIFLNSETPRVDHHDDEYEQLPSTTRRNITPKSILKRESIRIPYITSIESQPHNMELNTQLGKTILQLNNTYTENKGINSPNNVNITHLDDNGINLPYDSYYNIDLRTHSIELYQSSDAEWQWGQFIEFFFYHALFLFLLGPFTCIVLSKYPGIILMKNMKFYPSIKGTSFLRQSMVWLASIVGGLFYFIQNDNIITFTEMVFMWFAIFQKAIVVSAKYATFSQEMIKTYKTELLTSEVLSSHMMLNSWKIQPIDLIYSETQKSFKRHQQDQSKFHFQFLTQPSKDTIKSLQKMTSKDFDDDVANQTSTEINSFNGNRVISHFITQFQLIQPTQRMLVMNLFSVFVLSITPILLKIPQLIKNPASALAYFRLFLNASITFTTLSGCFLFLTLGIIDLQRKLYCLEQCSLMISTFKQQNSKKLVPTINLYNPQTIEAWSLLRSTCFDYGQTYNIRAQGFYSILFLANIISFILGLALTLGMLKFDIFQSILLLEVAIILIKNTAQYLILGAGINNYFDIFDSQLEDIKTLYLDTSTAKYEYFVSNTDPHNRVHKQFVNYIKKNVQNFDEVEDYLEVVIKAIENCQRIVRYDLRHNSFQLYGVPITFNLLKSAFVAFATIVGYAVQQRFSTMKK